MSSPIDTYEGADVVFTFGAGSFGTVLFFVLACVAFVAQRYAARMAFGFACGRAQFARRHRAVECRGHGLPIGLSDDLLVSILKTGGSC